MSKFLKSKHIYGLILCVIALTVAVGYASWNNQTPPAISEDELILSDLSSNTTYDNHHPPGVNALARKLNLTTQGRQVFNDIQVIEITDDIDCQGRDPQGCYTPKWIFREHTPHPSGEAETIQLLAGDEGMLGTFTHEFLHAVYNRLPFEYRNLIREDLLAVYQSNQDFYDSFFGSYSFYNQDGKLDEIYAYTGQIIYTLPHAVDYLIKDIPPNLIRHYRQFFYKK